MCGIAGLFDPRAARSPEVLSDKAARMAATLTHRGPDDSGVIVDAAAGLALAHARLSIIDLTSAGHQPMTSANERYVISYNGEIYNFEELRRDLHAEGVAFLGSSDTEVLVEACAAWGVEKTLPRLTGMFAFALWDRQARSLTLARDRLGIKPLYWGRVGETTLFASELKAIRAGVDAAPAINRDALAAYFQFATVPAPASIYQGVSKLPPGHSVTIVSGDSTPTPKAYWSLADVYGKGQRDPFTGTDADAVEALDALLGDAVSKRMISDVPLGAFLSGGIDSSLVAAIMQSKSSRPVRTFTLGFDQKGYDESAHARAIAEHLGTDHTEMRVTADDALAVIPTLADMYDEPFADSSAIPTALVSRLTRDHVTVALSGDGGDELFAGYNRYTWGESLWRRAGWLPRPVRGLAGCAIKSLREETWTKALSGLPGCPAHVGLQLHRAARVLWAKDGADVHRRIVSLWGDGEKLVPGSTMMDLPDEPAPDAAMVERMQALDAATYLPDDILTKVDRASMAVGLEARVPLVDHRVVEFAARTPRHMRIRNGQGKWLLRQVLGRYVPGHLTERPKMGFSIPLSDWLRGPLRDWADGLLSVDALEADNMLNAAPIRKAWDDHTTSRRNMSAPLWSVLMFQAWRQRWDVA